MHDIPSATQSANQNMQCIFKIITTTKMDASFTILISKHGKVFGEKKKTNKVSQEEIKSS